MEHYASSRQPAVLRHLRVRVDRGAPALDGQVELGAACMEWLLRHIPAGRFGRRLEVRLLFQIYSSWETGPGRGDGVQEVPA